MNKLYEKIILGLLFSIVLYNLVNYDIFEGNKKRRRRRRQQKRMVEMRKQQKRMVEMRKQQKETINKVGKKNKNVISKTDANKDNEQDKEISNLKTKIINTQRTSDRRKVISDRKMDKYIQLLYEQISNNTLKNQELKSFSEKKGRELQGNIDLLSSDLANNNIKYSDQMTEVKSKLDSLQKKVNSYEKNNSNVEEMLKNVNLQLETKYVNE
jgi:hypothetical protein